ncbi:MAG: GAF domain-containing protein [Candidatus Hydrogenedentota bacterium]|nr:MAG: GAF domain-containing protein [Candidatus Hydrogenedentota bacterium]
MNAEKKQNQYDRIWHRIMELTKGETDVIAVMATVVCELHNHLENFHWTGFYRVVEPELLKIGPYQGGHGCLRIPFDKGVCGAAARSRKTQVVPDVRDFPGHIACSPTTRSEIVVPVIDSKGDLIAVLDIDSNQIGSFDHVDKANLERLCMMIGMVGLNEY